MTTFFPGHVYRHTEKWPAFETIDEDTGEKDANGNPIFKKVLKPLTNVLTHHFLLPGPTQPASPPTEEIATAGGSVYASEFSKKWGIDVTTDPDSCTDGPMLTVHGKMFVGDDGNSATYEANAPHLYVKGRVGIGDRSPFNSNPAIFQAPPTHHLYVVGATMIEDPIDVADPAKLPPAVNPLFHVKGFTKIESPSPPPPPPNVNLPPNVTPSETNPLLHIAGQTVITGADKVADPKNTPFKLRVVGDTVLEGITTIVGGPLIVKGDTTVEGGNLSVKRGPDDEGVVKGGNLTVEGGDLEVKKDKDGKGGGLTVGGPTTLNQGATITGDLSVKGNTTVEGGNLEIKKDKSGKGGDLTVGGTTTLNGPLNANKGATITGDLTVKGNTTVEGGNLEIKEDESGKGGDLTVEDDASVGGDLTVKGRIRGGGINKRIAIGAAAGALAGAAIAVAVLKGDQEDDNDDEPPSSGAGGTALNPSIDNPTAPGPPQKPMLSIEGHGEFLGMLPAGGSTEPVRVRVGELLQNEAVPAKTKPTKEKKEEEQTVIQVQRKPRYGVEINWFDEFVRLELLARNKYNRDAVLVWGNDRFSRFVLRFNCDDKPPMSYDGQSSFAEKPSPDHRIRRPEPEMANDKPSELRGSRKLPPRRESKSDHVRDIMVVHPTGLIEVNGWVRARGYRQYSDMHMKDEIQPIASALTKVQALRGVRYVWADDEPNERDGEDGPHLGLIAQEVEQVLPEAVATDADEKKSVDYLQLTPLLIEAVKEQQTILDAQKRQIEALEQKIQQLMGLLEQKPQGG